MPDAEIHRYYIAKAHAAGIRDATPGSIAFTQRWGSALNLNPHLHIICIDGVYRRYGDFAKFRNLDRLTDDEVASLVESIATTSNPTAKHLKGLRALAEERIFKRFLLVCDVETERRTEDGIEILPWETFLNRLWAGDCV